MQLLGMVETNELNRSLLTILDENIASAQQGDQVIAMLMILSDFFMWFTDLMVLFAFPSLRLHNTS